MWSAVYTRFDLTYSVRVLSCYAHNLSFIHCILIKRVLRYVVEITNVELRFNRNVNDLHSDDLVSYSDSDFVDLKDKRHSTSEYVFMLVVEAIFHSSKQQQTIALSSCETEYMILSKTAKKAIWIKRFLHELDVRNVNQLIHLYADNKKAIDLITNLLFHKKIKHIKIRWHWIRKVIEKEKIFIHYLLIKKMLVDDLIKSLSVFAFANFKKMLHLSE
jgi:hypothetical protein